MAERKGMKDATKKRREKQAKLRSQRNKPKRRVHGKVIR